MKFEINFRKQTLNRLRAFVVVNYLISLIMLLVAVEVGLSANSYTIHISKQNDYLAELKAIEKQNDAEIKSNNTRDEATIKLASLMPKIIAKYQGRTPSSLLYALEKTVPDDVVVTSINYNRLKGKALIEVECKRPESAAKMLMMLEQNDEHRKVVLASQSTNDNGELTVSYEVTDITVGDNHAS